MDTSAVAESSRAFRDLEETFSHVIRALEHGLIEAKEYFDMKSLKIDGAVFSAIVRLHAREYLRGRQLDPEDRDFNVEHVNLCGLWLKIGRYHLKIWKISAPDLAKALRREASGGQLTLVDAETGIPIVLDLAIYWTADDALQLGQLYLVQPKEDDPRCFDWIWSREIPQVAATVEAITAGDIPLNEDVVETVRSNPNQ